MISLKVHNLEGAVVGEHNLNPEIFGLTVKPAIIQQAVVAQQANRRQVLAHTKGRGEVRGGGKKPWRQKGTGRARHGSIRSPLWRGGGVTFGPTKEVNFSLKINKKVKRQAILMTLSDKVANQKIILLDNLAIPEIKTKKFFGILQNLSLRRSAKKLVKKADAGVKKESKKKKDPRVLLVMDTPEEKLFKSARNIEGVTTVNAGSLNVLDILKHQYLLMPVAAVKKIEAIFKAK
ncbi:MAG: 50S ribosomal protein L4 [Candidatus Buchananbacteria bacterium RIFCSPLOWO2_01_FULL_46_12]|uniref:Large ribosomal subunit protein uL4 n=2 Tax=Candidatus Buchananiibacteriota TaxID=1817903 RepID=A0A1G1YSQ8_9BACT|nr:MAG: 50S ribosomal protein L4 [Candidatus Buchananbacteria bacterium RIFCSPHIGHO2_01_FULL_44_11]OGY54846.1 MAG: 50S ribosomal protein L4 [Candidatus Buchananbacteria bacterium RIFCSPLOWO2_01_FULL_46_12]